MKMKMSLGVFAQGCKPKRATMDVSREPDAASSARRRRERRLRAWWRHEQFAMPPMAAPAPVFEYVAPALVIENIAPVPAVIFDAASQQLPPVYITANVTTDVNLDVTSLVNPQPVLLWRGSAPQVVFLTSYL